MSISEIQSKLQSLSDRHADELVSLADQYNAAATSAYRHAAESLSGERVYEAIGRALTSIVQTARTNAQYLASSHALAELRAIAGSKAERLAIPMPHAPDPADCAQYVKNAVDDARAHEDDVVATAYRAATIIESETTNSYRIGREHAHSELRKMTDEQASHYGFRVARSDDDMRRDDNWLPLIGEMWNSRAEACDKCRAAHGEIRALGGSFSLPGPSAHARCQCVRTLWAIAVPVKERQMTDMQKEAQRDAQKDAASGELLRTYGEVATRQIDRANRTIVGAVASTEAIDSHGSKILAKGWNLERHNANPVLLWGHDRYSPESILGTARCYVKGGRLLADLQFSPAGINPTADLVFEQMCAGIVKGLSVGFRPLKYRYENENTAEELLVVEQQELVELSVVTVPSNPETLARQLRAMSNQGCSCDHEAALPQEQTMTEKTKETPAVDDSAVRVAELQLTLDKVTKERDAIAIERDALRAELDKRDAEEIKAEVDALVSAKVISEDKRDAAMQLRKAAPEAFRALYPKAAPVAPLAHLLDRVVTPEKPAKSTMGAQPEADAVIKRKDEILKNEPNTSPESAYSRAWDDVFKATQKVTL